MRRKIRVLVPQRKKTERMVSLPTSQSGQCGDVTQDRHKITGQQSMFHKRKVKKIREKSYNVHLVVLMLRLTGGYVWENISLWAKS